MGGSCIAIGSSSGSVYIMKKGYSKPVDSFQPSLLRPGQITKLAMNGDSTDVFISTGNTEIVHWDLASLRAIDSIELNSQANVLSRYSNELVVSTWDGKVMIYDTRTMQVVRELQQRGRSPMRVGRHRNQYYLASENGPCIFFDEDKAIRSTELWNRANDMIIHPTLDLGIIVGGETRLVDINCKKISGMTTSARGCRCCFDGERPLAAVGNDDGTVSIWRVPSKI